MTMRYGLIGCGMMGVEHLRNIALLDDVEVTSIFDPVEAQQNLGLQLLQKSAIRFGKGVNQDFSNRAISARSSLFGPAARSP